MPISGNYLPHGGTGGKTVGEVMADLHDYKKELRNESIYEGEVRQVREDADSILKLLQDKVFFTEYDIYSKLRSSVRPIQNKANVAALVHYLAIQIGQDPFNREARYTTSTTLRNDRDVQRAYTSALLHREITLPVVDAEIQLKLQDRVISDALIDAEMRASLTELPSFISDIGTRENFYLNVMSQQSGFSEMLALAEANSRARDPAYHFTLSWGPGEIPTRRQMMRAVKILMKKIGMENQPAKVTYHFDTDNVHLHLLVNKTDISTFKQHIVPYPQLQVMQAAAIVAYEQGWGIHKDQRYIVDKDGLKDMDPLLPESERLVANKAILNLWLRGERDQLHASSNGDRIYEKNRLFEIENTISKKGKVRLSRKQRDMEANSGVQSATRYASVVCKKILPSVMSWDEFHREAARMGINIKPFRRGLAVSVHYKDGESVVLAGRRAGLQLKSLMRKFGIYQPSVNSISPVNRLAMPDQANPEVAIEVASKRTELRRMQTNELAEMYERHEGEIEAFHILRKQAVHAIPEYLSKEEKRATRKEIYRNYNLGIKKREHSDEYRALRRKHINENIDLAAELERAKVAKDYSKKQVVLTDVEAEQFYKRAWKHYNSVLPENISNKHQRIDQRIALAAFELGIIGIETIIEKYSPAVTSEHYSRFIALYPTSDQAVEVAEMDRRRGISFFKHAKSEPVPPQLEPIATKKKVTRSASDFSKNYSRRRGNTEHVSPSATTPLKRE